jgi:molybdate transport system ATP-binding protein
MSNIEARFSGRLGSFTLDAGFSIPGEGITGLFGPSGCGKTTILRCLAGLTRLADGYLSIDGVVWQGKRTFLAPYKRPVGYVFQEPCLFAHLSVLENLRYGLVRNRERSPSLGLESVIELMGIRGLLERSAAGLSGGEKQRIAIGRALLSQPRFLLMDEPLSALDRQSRNEILPYLETLHQTLSMPIMYVSHDFLEIERLADHLVLMTKEGRVQACGVLTALLTDLSLPIARQPDAAVVLTVTAENYDEAYDITECGVDGAQFLVPGVLGPQGTQRRIRVRASDVSLVKGEQPRGTSVLNILPARVLSAQTANANQMLVLLGLAGTTRDVKLLSSVTRKSWDMLGLKAGDFVFAQVKSMALADRSGP